MLLWLLAVPVVAGLIWLAMRRRDTSAARFAAADMMDGLIPRAGWKIWVPPVLIVIAVAAGAIAAARPERETKVPREQATLILTLDTSLSMMATDVLPDRMSAAKSAAEEVLTRLPEQMRAGVVAFAATANVVAQPNRDRAAAIAAVRSLRLNEGTAVGNAIVTSLEALGDAPALNGFGNGGSPEPDASGDFGDSGDEVPPSAIVLLSDGDTVIGTDPLDAAQQARDAGVPIYTIAFGTGDATIEIGGQTIPVSVDEQELREIAEVSGGEFFRAFDESTLENIFSDIGTRVGLEDKTVDLTPYFVAAAVILLVGALGTSLVWYGRMM